MNKQRWLQEEEPIVENRLSCPVMLLIIAVIAGLLIVGCIKMCN